MTTLANPPSGPSTINPQPSTTLNSQLLEKLLRLADAALDRLLNDGEDAPKLTFADILKILDLAAKSAQLDPDPRPPLDAEFQSALQRIYANPEDSAQSS